MQLRFARLGSRWIDSRSGTIASRPLAIPVRQPSQPKLWSDGAGGVHLFWLDSETGQEPTLYHTLLSLQGNVLSPPRQVAAGGAVAGYAIAQAGLRRWTCFGRMMRDRRRPFTMRACLWLIRTGYKQKCCTGEALPDIRGAMPAAMTDAQRRIHLVWYGSEPRPGRGRRLCPVRRRGGHALGTGLDRPSIRRHKSILPRSAWIGSAPMSSGRRSVAGEAWAPLRRDIVPQPGARRVREPLQDCQLAVPVTDQPKYAAAEGELSYHALAPLDPSRSEGLSDYTYMPYPVPGQRQELAVVLSTRMVSRRGRGELQIVLAILRGGQAAGYETAGQTSSASLRPIAVADAQGQVHLAWLDTAGFGDLSPLLCHHRSPGKGDCQPPNGEGCAGGAGGKGVEHGGGLLVFTHAAGLAVPAAAVAGGLVPDLP